MPVPPLPLNAPVTTVPGEMPGPVMGAPTDRAPEVTLVTDRVVPEIEPTKEAAKGAPSTPAAGALSMLGTDTVYVPTPPVPDPKPVTTVPGATPGALTGMPAAITPALTEATVIVGPAMEALKKGTCAANNASTTASGSAAMAAGRVAEGVGVTEGVPLVEVVREGVPVPVPGAVPVGVGVPLPVLVGVGVEVDVGVAVGVGAAVLVAGSVPAALSDGESNGDLEEDGASRPDPVARKLSGAEADAVEEASTDGVAGAVPPSELVGEGEREGRLDGAAVPVPNDALGVPDAKSEVSGEPVGVPFSADALSAAEGVECAVALCAVLAVAHGVVAADAVALPGEGAAEAVSLLPLPLGGALSAGLRDEEREAAAEPVVDGEGVALREGRGDALGKPLAEAGADEVRLPEVNGEGEALPLRTADADADGDVDAKKGDAEGAPVRVGVAVAVESAVSVGGSAVGVGAFGLPVPRGAEGVGAAEDAVVGVEGSEAKPVGVDAIEGAADSEGVGEPFEEGDDPVVGEAPPLAGAVGVARALPLAHPLS